MAIAWVSLSTRWDLSSVQAALNVILSVLSTAGIWSFSRYWWQQGSANILRGDTNIPLSALLTLSSPGEGWDAITVLRKKVFDKENWHLLFQMTVVIMITVTSMLSGPIAKVSLRSSRTIQTSELGVQQTIKGDGGVANLLEANVLWNDTIKSLDEAEFPYDQLLDYLPPSTAAWTYVAREWDPTWTMACRFTPEQVLHNVVGSGNNTFYDPINAFPAYRDTYDQSWLNTSTYRYQADFNSYASFADPASPPFKDVLFYILLQSNPETNDRMDTNKDTLQISLSVLHAQDFRATNYADVTEAAATKWQPVGSVGNASFTRVECNLTRKPDVQNESAMPWPWLNDTYSITYSYRSYLQYEMEVTGPRGQIVFTPTPEENLRFYQAYIATVNTQYALPSPRQVSIWMDTVQVSTVFVSLVIFLTCLILYLIGRYFCFLHRNKSKLDEVYVPDGKMEWMIHTAKVSAQDSGEQVIEGKRTKDRDHFRTATFGYINTPLEGVDAELQRPSLARVYSAKTSVSRVSACNARGIPKGVPLRHYPIGCKEDGKGDKHDNQEKGLNLNQNQNSQDSHSVPEVIVSSAGEDSESFTRGQTLDLKGNIFSTQISRRSSTGTLLNLEEESSELSFRSIVRKNEDVERKDDPTDSILEQKTGVKNNGYRD